MLNFLFDSCNLLQKCHFTKYIRLSILKKENKRVILYYKLHVYNKENGLIWKCISIFISLNSRWLFQKAQEKMCEIEQRKCKYDINPYK